MDSKGGRKVLAKARMSRGISGEHSLGALTSLGNEVIETRLTLLSIPIPELFLAAPHLPLCTGLNSVLPTSSPPGASEGDLLWK